MPVWEAKWRIPSSEFVGWKRRLRDRMNERTRETAYLQQIAAEVRRTRVKDPKQVQLSHLELEFKTRATRHTVNTTDKAERTVSSKTYWFGLMAAAKAAKENNDRVKGVKVRRK